MNKAVSNAALAALLVSSFAPIASAQVIGYAIDQRSTVVKSGYDLCWRTGYWTPALALPDCDADLVPKPAPAPAPTPRAAAPVPPPAPVAAAPVPKPAPVPVAPPPVKLAVVAPIPPKPCDLNMALESDQLFEFGKASLTGPAKARLDKEILGRIGTCAQLDSVVVEGHTDRIGGTQANQKLSERRAAEVKAYLVSKGVAADKIQTAGKGESAPTKECADSRNRKQLIECLAPNRRVAVFIKGTGK